MIKPSLAVALILIYGMYGASVDATEAQPKPSTCPVTLPAGGRYENESLAVGIRGKFVFRPGGQGFVDSDGAMGIKVLWTRKVRGTLEVGGKRLDGLAPPARAYLKDYGDTGIQPSYLLFPTPGCWKITGRVGNTALTFVVLVEKVASGPTWRFRGPEPGSRVSSISVEGA